MKLSVTNLAWTGDAALTLLRRLGVKGIEVAPTRIAEWHELGPDSATEYRKRIEDHGLVVSSTQAILYGRPELQLLGDHPEALYAHIRLNAGIAQALGAEVMVLGAGANRQYSLAPDVANLLARDRLAMMGRIAHEAGVILGLEPTGDFLGYWEEVLEMVISVGSLGLGVHLDTACLASVGSDIQEAILASQDYLVHFHASEPNLGNFSKPMESHKSASKSLIQIGYHDWVVIEMLNQPVSEINRAVSFVQRTYNE